MKPFIYIIGEPGIGKTAVARELIKQGGQQLTFPPPVKATFLRDSKTFLLGHYDRAFGGTDTLGYTCQKPVCAALESLVDGFDVSLVFGEGDRLANDSFFNWASIRFKFILIRLIAPNELVIARRKERGSNQNETWLKGRASKVKRLAEVHRAAEVSATNSSDEVLRQCLALLSS